MKLLALTAFLATSVISRKYISPEEKCRIDKERTLNLLNNYLFEPIVLTNPRFSDGKYYNYGGWNLPPSLSIDGVISGGKKRSNFAHSSGGKEKQFTVDVGNNAVAHISEVTIHPRQDCTTLRCWDRYSGMEVFLVSLEEYGNDNRYKCEAVSALDAESVRSARASGLKWKCPYLDNVKRILVINPDWVDIQIAEIAAFGLQLTFSVEQLTLSNPRFSDNTYWKRGDFDLPPKAAIDGKWIDHNPWTGYAHSWKSKKFLVDLPENSVVEKITIYPRQDYMCKKKCYELYAKMTVKVGNVSCTTEQDLSAKSVSSAKKTGLVFTCENAYGPHIVVENPSNVHLQIAEIVAIGH